MIHHFLTLLIRSLWKQRFYTSINLVGLILGLSVSSIIYLYVDRELSVDKSIALNPNTYRLLRQGDIGGSPYLIGVTSGPFAEALPLDFPQEVDKTLRVMTSERWVRYEDKIFGEEKFALADSTFFDVFAFKLIQGNTKNALKHANNVVITKKIAQKYFGDEDPINKVIRVSDRYDLLVAGVIDQPTNPTHIDFDFLGNIELLRERPWFSEWWNNAMITYVVLKEAVDYQRLNRQLPLFMNKYFGEDFANNGTRIDILLQPFEEVYFEKEVRYDPIHHGNKSTVYIFSFVGIFILVIGIINFINLATARSVSRGREVGIKKMMGSTKAQLILQFLLESIIMTGVALCVSLMLVEVTLPYFNDGFNLSLEFKLTTELLVKIIVFLIIISLLSGIYPAFILSSFNSIQVLKGNVKSGPGASQFRKVLVTFQFAISTFLLIGTFVVGKQLNFLKSKPLGFDKEAILLIESNNSEIYSQRETFKNLLLKNSSIKNVCMMNGEPGGFHDTMSLQVEGLSTNPRMRTNFVDENYAETFGLTLVAGRNFSNAFPADLTHSVMLNEAGARELGWQPLEAIGKQVKIHMMDSVMKTIVGVVKDFHFTSLHTPIEPLIISMSNKVGDMGIKISSENYQNTIKIIEEAWNKVSPQYPFQFQFLDDKLNAQYQSERLQGSLFTLFSFISLIVASLGIVGLATFASVQRLKEVGVRKVLGASAINLSVMLMKDLILLAFLAAILAWPFAWAVVEKWLGGFAYRVELGAEYFFLSTAITLAIALFSVSYQSIKVALVNPIEVIKEE